MFAPPEKEQLQGQQLRGQLGQGHQDPESNANPESNASPESNLSPESNVSADEQAQYDEFVTNGQTLIYSDAAMQHILPKITKAGDIKDGLAQALVTLVLQLQSSAKNKGTEISSDVLLHGAQEILEIMVDVVEVIRGAEISPDDMEGALYRAMDIWREREESAGTLDKTSIDEDWQSLQQADAEGRLANMIQGLNTQGLNKQGVNQ